MMLCNGFDIEIRITRNVIAEMKRIAQVIIEVSRSSIKNSKLQ